ncbi:MAG: transketolase [Candidatus Margulisbacteria bacterium]|nr:transketolase [Candidatus Margulisiibacteriota bacterium]
MITKDEIHEILTKACIVRSHVLDMTCAAKSGHPGGSLSIAEIISTLYFYWLKLDPKNPKWEERDYFVLAKGHAAPAQYAAMAERGFFPLDYLKTLRQLGSKLQGHPDRRSLPGIEMTTGSLGQGLSVMVGMGLGLRLNKKKNRIYGVLGDGECQEGQVWEAAMAASHFKLDNLVIFVDKNQLQIDGSTKDIMNIDPLADKWASFGWQVFEVDGHNIMEIVSTLEKTEKIKGKPCVIIANTVKGKGVSFMENQLCFHGAPCTDEQLVKAKQEIKETRGKIG